MYVPVTTTSSETNRPRRRFSPAVFPIMSMPRPRGRSRFSRANGDHPPGSARGGLRITKAPCRTAPICVGMFEPRAVPVVINLDIRNAVPMPVPPMVLPANVMPAPPAGVVNQLDRRCGAKLDCVRLGCGRGRRCRCRQGEAAHKCNDQRAHFCLRRNPKTGELR